MSNTDQPEWQLRADPLGRQAAYRIHKLFLREGKPKGYRYSLDLLDEPSQLVLASCDVTGPPANSTLVITDEQGRSWTMAPNRKLMPTRWSVTDPAERIAMQFDLKLMGKLVNPVQRVALALLDGEGKEVHRVIDPRTSIPDRLLGTGPNDWILTEGDRPVARLARLPRRPRQPGIIGFLKGLLIPSDPGIVSLGPSHALSPPVALGMMIVFNEVTNVSGGSL